MNLRTALTGSVLGLFLALAFASASAQDDPFLIDFETIQGDPLLPADQVAITDQYAPLDFGGVTFSLINEDGSPFLVEDPFNPGEFVEDVPYLEASGDLDEGAGFFRLWPIEDAAQDIEREGFSGVGLGDFFLRLGTDSLFGAPVPILQITYTEPVDGAAAQIWDIDSFDAGTEQWRVDALNDLGEVIGSLDSPVFPAETGVGDGEDSLDGLPWLWSFEFDEAAIEEIRITFIGTKETDIGLSFDNFSPASSVIPVPPALWLFASALLVLFRRGRGNRAD